MKLRRKLGLTCALALGTVAAAATIGFTTVSCSSSASDYNPSQAMTDANFTQEAFDKIKTNAQKMYFTDTVEPSLKAEGCTNISGEVKANLNQSVLTINVNISATTKDGKSKSQTMTYTYNLEKVGDADPTHKDDYKVVIEGTKDGTAIPNNDNQANGQLIGTFYKTKTEVTNMINTIYNYTTPAPVAPEAQTLESVKITLPSGNITDATEATATIATTPADFDLSKNASVKLYFGDDAEHKTLIADAKFVPSSKTFTFNAVKNTMNGKKLIVEITVGSNAPVTGVSTGTMAFA